ncbi:MAG TPA: hypothetical protein VFV73_36975 [Streptosporangiaceae bacterium]|nr:hypothetical protein [Streptosporangiaceae bacterium]
MTDARGRATGHACARPEPGRQAPPEPDPPGFTVTRAGPGPPGGYGTWRFTTGIPGQRAWLFTIDPIPAGHCDHRYQADGHDPGVKLRHLTQIRHATCTGPMCERPSGRADFEHNIPFDKGGRTCLCNTGPVRDLFAELMPQAEVTVCRLRADRRELVRERCRDWPGCSGSPSPPGREDGADRDFAAEGADGEVLLICGPPGVGKSTIGFQLYRRYLHDGRTAGYVDLDQIGFIRPSPDDDPGRHRLKAGNLAAMWRTYHAAGARHLVATGPVESDEALRIYVRALPAARVTAVRLHADRAELARRIMTRGAGGSWPQPGDPLRGQPREKLLLVADRAAAEARALERVAAGMVRIDTDGLTVTVAVDAIAAVAG